jgi:Fe2+ or Zn2+ uptake regulation protein
MGAATVYQNVQRLTRTGLVRRLIGSDGHALRE